VAEKQFSSIPPEIDSNGFMTWAKFWVLTLQRKFPEALAAVQNFRGEMLSTNNTAPAPKSFLEGTIHLL
jgi:hypothetical protein